MYYKKEASEVLKEFNSSINGLTSKEAELRLNKYGKNEITNGKKFTKFKIMISQFKNIFLLLLITAGLLSFILGENIETIAIFVIIILNILLGFIQEYRAEKAIDALRNMAAPNARVLREGIEQKIPTKELVPGDIILIDAGDLVPADARLIEVSSLELDEAALTGESISSSKTNEKLEHITSVMDQKNMIFMGTIVTYGKGKAVVTATALNTEFGKIAASVKTTNEVETPLQKKFSQLAKQIGIITIVLILSVVIFGAIQGSLNFAKLILFALALTVSTIPNSLPIIVTIGLSLGTSRLAKKNMLIKKLPAAESLGAATIIISDKTGTITKNEMTVTKLFYNNKIINVTGSGYEPKGNFYLDNNQLDQKETELLLRASYLCNNAKLIENNSKFEIIGDPTEGSLIVMAKKGGFSDKYFTDNFTIIKELPFDSDRKMMSVIVKNELNNKAEGYVKGAPESILKICTKIVVNKKIRLITKSDLENIKRINEDFANSALRVLAIAYRNVSKDKKYVIKDIEKDLIFVGLVGMIDPPREEVKSAVERCNEAGIKVMMITGDHKITAIAIAKQIGLLKQNDITITGEDLDKMSNYDIEMEIENIRIISRALPIQKLRIVEILQKKGHVVAVTGDGVNDAPALKRADIGISMGIKGTDVAKEVSKATLVDDNFATIVNAIEEGKNIYDKMIKSARYLLSCNASEVIAVFIAVMLKLPLPLLPLQILLMSLLTDDFPALGLGFESGEEGIMKRSPRNPKANPISRQIFHSIILFGVIMGIGTLLIFMHYLDDNLGKAQTVAFTTLVMFQMFAVMSSRTLYPSLKHLNPLSNKWLFGAVCVSLLIQVIVIYWQPLQNVFGTISLNLIDWIKILAVSSLGFILMELSKFIANIDNKEKIRG